MDPRQFAAHIRLSSEGREVQPNWEHCRNTARLAAQDLSSIGLGSAAKLAGLLHDAGKGPLFTEYIEKVSRGEHPRRGSVNHTFAGCRYLLDRYHRANPEQRIVAEILAYGVGAHHGLFDVFDQRGENGFSHRLQKKPPDYEEAIAGFLSLCAAPQELDALFRKADEELEEKLTLLSQISETNEELSFYGGLLVRLLLSAVIDGDCSDTAAFLNGTAPPELPKDMEERWKERLAFLEGKLGELPQDSPIAKARSQLSDRSARLGELPTGVYRLTLPTGGGKTLTSLRAGLAHAARKKKRRMIFAIPLLSVLDQNARVIREYLGDDSMVLEHHSNLIREDKEEGEEDTRKLLTENWSSPVILTTLVQVLNTLFDGRNGCIRRMQAFADSILILDEVQTVPTRFLTLFNLALNFLVRVCNTTILLCSATQPCLEAAAHPLRPTPRELIPYDPELWQVFSRTTLRPVPPRRLEEIGPFLLEQPERTLLCVCNTKAEAAQIFRQLEGIERYHLSASMCMAHRRDTLAAMERAKSEGHRLICVSTQVIEAGMDISFHKAIRLEAGLDNIIQTAGRCNRNGEVPQEVPVLILRCSDEKLNRLQEIDRAKTATESLLDQFRRDPQAVGGALDSRLAIAHYYRHLYRNQGPEAQDGAVRDRTLFDLLSDNGPWAGKNPALAEQYWLHQAFATAGAQFKVFDTNTYDVLVPYKEGAEIIAQLCSQRASRDLGCKAGLLERAKPYTVSIWEYQKQALEKRGGLAEENDVLMLRPDFYDSEALGLVTESGTMEFLDI